MKKRLLTCLPVFFFAALHAQTPAIQTFNLDFEETKNGVPIGWQGSSTSSYAVALDSNEVKSGKYSASIEYKEGAANFNAWAFILPANYAGKKITLSGYIKTSNVTEGYAGLWMRIDPTIAFDNMNKKGITGTTDWKKYEITLTMNPERTKNIVIGGLLQGKGKMWLDDFKISIDGKDIAEAKPMAKKEFLADKDNEFIKGSNISTISLNTSQTQNLKTLGLVWGFLKYYHPTIAKGSVNWDYELFRVMPIVLGSKSLEERDRILINWIEKLGSFPKGKENKVDDAGTKLRPDLDWITKSGFSNELSTLLSKIKNADRPKEHYYITLAPGVMNAIFINENPYTAMKYPDAGFRLLALFRYWNMIQYYFPYKNLIEEDWKNVLEEFIPKMNAAGNETEYTLSMLELIARVNDTHANIWGGNPVLGKYFGTLYAPIETKFVENKAVVTGYYDDKLGKDAGLEIGDVITSVNNKPVEEIIKEKLKYTAASNYPTQLRDIARNLLRTNDSTINIEYVRNEQKQTATVKAFSTKQISISRNYNSADTSFKVINNNVAYIHNGRLKKTDLPKIWKDVEKTKGLIIDIRNYPSDFPIYNLSSYLMPTKNPFVKVTTGSIETPGLFLFERRLLEVGDKNNNYYKGKVVILVNEESQSSAEFHAMAYRVHPNAIVIGSTTAAADGNVSNINLPGGITTMISGIGIYYPDGKETQRIGIVPDIEVKPTIKGVKERRDEVLEKALQIINEQKGSSSTQASKVF